MSMVVNHRLPAGIGRDSHVGSAHVDVRIDVVALIESIDATIVTSGSYACRVP